MTLPTLAIKGKLYSEDPEELKSLSDYIPYKYIIDWFYKNKGLTKIHNKVLVLKSETASGKSTLLPAELYKEFIREKSDRSIICTQPRIITTVENVHEIIKNYSSVFTLGVNIGWSTKDDKHQITQNGLMSVTVGTLNDIFIRYEDDYILDKYEFIIVDEVHEREISADLAIYQLKLFIQRNLNDERCPFVIFMSATFDENIFLNYFKLDHKKNYIHVVGKTAGFDTIWLDKPSTNNSRSIVNAVKTIVEKGEDDINGDILIFLPSKLEMEIMAPKLADINKKFIKLNKLDQLISVSVIDSAEIKELTINYINTILLKIMDLKVKVGKKMCVPKRRVILSTNTLETGVTIETLKYVIDSGYNREVIYFPIQNISALLSVPNTKYRINQRRGRAGRKFKGVFYPMYTEETYNKLANEQIPQIITINLSSFYMQLINAQIKEKTTNFNPNITFNVEDIDLLVNPTADTNKACLEKLYTLGYIKNEINGISFTKLGKIASKFNLEPESTKIVLSSYFWETSTLDCITIISFIDLQKSLNLSAVNWNFIYKNIFEHKFIVNPNKLRYLIFDNLIDVLVLFESFKNFITAENYLNDIDEWCKQSRVPIENIFEFIKVRENVIDEFILNGFDVFKNEIHAFRNINMLNFVDTVTKLKYCIYEGFKNNMLLLEGENYVTNKGINVTVNYDMYFKKGIKIEYQYKPKVILYTKLELKSRRNEIHKVRPKYISIMDNYVKCDMNFLN